MHLSHKKEFKNQMKIRKIADEQYKIKLPGEIITIGPGTVPTSTASVSKTSIKEVSSGLRRASRIGLFDPTSSTR